MARIRVRAVTAARPSGSGQAGLCLLLRFAGSSGGAQTDARADDPERKQGDHERERRRGDHQMAKLGVGAAFDRQFVIDSPRVDQGPEWPITIFAILAPEDATHEREPDALS